MTEHAQDSHIRDLQARSSRGEIDRRDFLAGLAGMGMTSSAAVAAAAGADKAAAAPRLESKTFRVTGYNIRLGDKLLITVAGKTIAPRAVIDCTGDNQEQLTLFFLSRERPGDENNSDRHPNTTTLTANRTLGTMFLPVQQYTWYVDLLRNEDPVYATLDSSQPLNNRLECGEHVGDGELREIVG